MKVAALGGVETTQETAQQQNVQNGQELVRIALYTALQAAFIAPGLYLVGVRGWRLFGASFAGSASFTLLSWLWAYAHNASMVPIGMSSSGSDVPNLGKPRRVHRRPQIGAPQPEIIDL